jgi:hypothetical protein
MSKTKERTRVRLLLLKDSLLGLSASYRFRGIADAKALHKALYDETMRSLYSGEAWFPVYYKGREEVPVPVKQAAENDIALAMAFFALSRGIRDLQTLSQGSEWYWNQGRAQALKAENTQEADMKRRVYDYVSEKARNERRVFWICSRHDDCAKDHVAWQGRYYVSEDWQSICLPEDRTRISGIIRKRGIMPLQWVEGSPVWLMTRPNCRHYFESVPTELVESKEADVAVRELGMSYQVGPRGTFQTKQHVTRAEWYTSDNIKSMVDFYADRLALHQTMAHYAHSGDLNGQIMKDRTLLDRWIGMEKGVL